MPFTIRDSQRGMFRAFLHRIRKTVPEGLRAGIWRHTAQKVFERMGFDSGVPLFSIIALETRTRCNSACSFCQASILTDQRQDLLMPDDLIDKVFQELISLKYAGRIQFFVNNEPLLDKRMVALVERAVRDLPEALTEVHTNGMKLNARIGRELLAAGLHILHINNYSDTNELPPGTEAFIREVVPEYPEREILLHRRRLTQVLQNRAGTAPNAEALHRSLQVPCVYPFEYLGITWNGDVAICCQDHYFSQIMGNIRQKSLSEIWYGDAFMKVRGLLREGNRSAQTFCAGCDFRGYKEEHLTPAESVLNRAVGTLWNGE